MRRCEHPQREINRVAMAMGHDRGGAYAHLFDVDCALFADAEGSGDGGDDGPAARL